MYDVAVIGGGPAGSAVSTWLRRSGLEVGLFERTAFPRHHIGESLLAMSMPLLDDLGVTGAMQERGFLRKTGSLFRWNDEVYSLGMPHPGQAYQVDRASFDAILLDRARAEGVTVHERTLVTGLLRDGEGRCGGVRCTDEMGQAGDVSARWTVDASGLAQFRSRKTEAEVEVDGARRVAVSAYFRGSGRAGAPHTNNIITEAVRDGWLWFIPLTASVTSVGFVTSELTSLAKPAAALLEQIGTSVLVRPLLDGAEMTRTPATLRYTNHVAAGPLVEPGLVSVGDSAMFVDPLFSTGVHGALQSARQAAAALCTVAAGARDADDVARWYDREVREHYDRVRTMVRLLYAAHRGTSPFWRSMTLDDMTEAEAAAAVGRLGPSGAAFFTEETRGLLALPPAFRRALQVVNPPPRATVPYQRTEPLALASHVRSGPDLTRAGAVLVPAVRLVNGRNGLTVSYPVDSMPGVIVTAARDGVDPEQAHELVRRRGFLHERGVVERLLGTLLSTGMLAPRPGVAGSGATA